MICMNWMGKSFALVSALFPFLCILLFEFQRTKIEKYDFDLIFGCHVSCLYLLSAYALMTHLGLSDFLKLLFLLTCLWTVVGLFLV